MPTTAASPSPVPPIDLTFAPLPLTTPAVSRAVLPEATTDIIRRALGLPVTLEEHLIARTEDAQRRGELAFLDDEVPLFVDEMMLPYFPRAR